MEIARLHHFLTRHSRFALDTCIFIYQWEADPRYSGLTDSIFSSLEQSDFSAVTSTITMTELLVHPYRKNDMRRVAELIHLFTTYPNLEWIAPQLEIAAHAADIRAQFSLQTPDAIQAATAVHGNATVLVTNDPIFKRVPEFHVLLLDDYV